jgi:hypothetical protein
MKTILIRDPGWKKGGSGTNIPDPQHCPQHGFLNIYLLQATGPGFLLIFLNFWVTKLPHLSTNFITLCKLCHDKLEIRLIFREHNFHANLLNLLLSPVLKIPESMKIYLF